MYYIVTLTPDIGYLITENYLNISYLLRKNKFLRDLRVHNFLKFSYQYFKLKNFPLLWVGIDNFRVNEILKIF